MRLSASASVGAAVFCALYGIPHPAIAQEQPSSTPTKAESLSSPLQEVIVTAQRREQTLESVPSSLTVVSADQIARTGVTDLVDLARQVPGLDIYDFGARSSGTVFPIIRGINASAGSAGTFRTFEQAPVGTYIGNSPIDGYFQLDDVQRVEVLRGPQGTLYGAGALSGALRIIPNAPELGTFSGGAEVGGGAVSHSDDMSYMASAMLNIPLGDTLAFRVSGRYDHEPGFIDVYGILKRSPETAIPVLADPADPVNSPGVFYGKSDWNDQNTFTGRAGLLWKPLDKFNAQLAFTYANATGDGGPVDNPVFQGGSYPIDPRITFPAGGNYKFFSATDQPWSRRTTLGSLDLSYDAGFATLSSNSSYFTTRGSNVQDLTYTYASFPAFAGYYAGNPINPRFVSPQTFADTAHTFTQELRLVSDAGPDKRLDYVVGLFYENQTREGSWEITTPGTPEYAMAQGCTGPYAYPGTPPNCLPVTGPDGLVFQQTDTQHFEDKSEFGELTWHFVRHGQITVGVRHFDQSFTDTQVYSDWAFGIFVPEHSNSTPASKNTWKVNPSYEYAANHYVYALWSQGFRRGGANALPSSGFFAENNPALLSYAPDSTDNYEIGLKGRADNGLSYAFDVFDIEWDKPQVAGQTPASNFAVWNANKARSTGAELDLNSPLFLSGLSITVGGSYQFARFTEDYLINADAFGNITGKAGQQLPGSPKTSAAATINYQRKLFSGYELTVSLNDTYRSAVPLTTFPILGGTAVLTAPGMNIVNFSSSIDRGPWRLGAYITNLADKRAIQIPGSGPPITLGGLVPHYGSTISQPREIELRLRYSF